MDFIHLGEGAQMRCACSTRWNRVDRNSIARRVQISAHDQEFGIVAITRKRSREPLVRRTSVGLRRPQRVRAGCPPPIVWRWKFCAASSARPAANPVLDLVVTAAPDVMAWLTRHADEVSQALLRRGRGPGAFRGGRKAGRRL